MRNRLCPQTVLVVLLVLAAVVSGCAGASADQAGAGVGAGGPLSAPATSTSPERISGGGAVTVKARWGGPADGASFEVALDTHTVDLDAIDLADATLGNDRGEKLSAGPWEAAKGGHHRSGELVFAGDATAFFADARWVELVIPGVGDVPERVLRWEIVP